MKSTEQMLEEGREREVKLACLGTLNNLVVKFLMVAVEDEAMDDIIEQTAAFANLIGNKALKLAAENDAAFQAFQEATAEVDALEAMLQDGGIEQ